MAKYYIDTNLFIRVIAAIDGVSLSEEAYKFFKLIENGELSVTLIEAIFTEICYVLSSPRQPYKLSHKDIKDKLLVILKFPGIAMNNKEMYIEALNLYEEYENLDIEDCLLLVYSKSQKAKLISFDSDFDKQQYFQSKRISSSDQIDL